MIWVNGRSIRIPSLGFDWLAFSTSDGGVVGGYPHPGCQNVQGSCGKCYSVSNFGAYPTDTGAQIGKTIVVQIVDACPAGSALNYCKVKENPPIPADERCGAGNSLDIDYSAYKDLTGTDYTSVSVSFHLNGLECYSNDNLLFRVIKRISKFIFKMYRAALPKAGVLRAEVLKVVLVHHNKAGALKAGALKAAAFKVVARLKVVMPKAAVAPRAPALPKAAAAY